MNDVVLILFKMKGCRSDQIVQGKLCLSLITHRYSTQCSSSGAETNGTDAGIFQTSQELAGVGIQVPRVLTRDFSLSLSLSLSIFFNMRLLSTKLG